MEINKKLITKEAKHNMLTVHGEKYIKAWIDVKQFKKTLDGLVADYDLVSPEAKQRVEEFVNQRIGNPQGQMVPAPDIANAVSLKLGIDASQGNLRTAELEFNFFADVIQQIETL